MTFTDADGAPAVEGGRAGRRHLRHRRHVRPPARPHRPLDRPAGDPADGGRVAAVRHGAAARRTAAAAPATTPRATPGRSWCPARRRRSPRRVRRGWWTSRPRRRRWRAATARTCRASLFCGGSGGAPDVAKAAFGAAQRTATPLSARTSGQAGRQDGGPARRDRANAALASSDLPNAAFAHLAARAAGCGRLLDHPDAVATCATPTSTPARTPSRKPRRSRPR